ncbi:cytochrome P450 [Polyporus arcularius HHB13444]|uniref:Cytochrome P450 n=1 Tax=Polyporus arcularius HHB13444 TaxID=1314778 RepID=A0A5C3PX29_9APHY|nr:cytochrome P450 [Polyporus arcularius HHB13444]
MSEGLASPVGLVTQSPLAFALILVGLYWGVKILRTPDASRPPRASYWIPWLGSALEMGKDPDGFFSNMTKLHGPVFTVKALGQEMVYVTSPSLISTVYRDSQNFDFTSIRVEMGYKVFQLREHISSAPYMVDTYMGQLHNLLLPSNIHPIVEAYTASAHDSLLSMISSMDGASGALKTFIIPSAYRAACHAGFGRDFPAEKSYPFFKAFDDDFHLIGAGLPKFLLSKPLKAWDELVDVIENYVKEQDEKREDLNQFLAAGLDGYRRGEWTSRDTATVLACQLWALQANAIFTAYWLLAILLQQPEGLDPIVAELDAARRQWQAAHPSKPLGPAFFETVATSSKSLPLLSSAIQETLRVTTSTFSPRRVVNPVQLGGYQLLPGDRVICVTRLTHLDDDIHPHAREFDMRRYLQTPRATKDGKPVANHSMPFGGGTSMCEGRHFALAELRVFLAILLTYATIDIDEGCMTRPEFALERMGLGVMHPKGDMDVVLRKRRL